MQQRTVSYREEKLLNPVSGFPMLIISTLLCIISIAAFVLAVIALEERYTAAMVTVVTVTAVYYSIVYPILMMGLKAINPNEAAVYVLFGRYYGTIAQSGFYWIHPFCAMLNPTAPPLTFGEKQAQVNIGRKKISLKAMTLNNEKQKINDREGNPIDIGVVVIWRVVNATKAVFEVENYKDYVSIQSDAAIRHVARQYPYDISEDGEERSLRGSSNEVAIELKRELQSRVELAGVEIIEVRISHLAYAQEIAAAMLQRQQAAAVIAARQKIVDGAVGMVEMALKRLADNDVLVLDDERKAAMVSNLLVVLCGNKDAQPIVNSGSIY
jgi:regulator of protease activity HflC (stomatin/prohibitin superfamily)